VWLRVPMDEVSRVRRTWLWVECLAVFFALPALLVIAGETFGRLVIPTLLLLAAGCMVLLLRDPTFDRRRLVGSRDLGAGVRRILTLFLPTGAIVGLAVWLLLPERFVAFPLQRPQLWLVVMLLYPLLSVCPQELLFRTFFFHRYRPLFGERWLMITTSALAFGMAHLFFANPVAPIMSAIGGGLFAWTYARSESTLQAVIEHALWGDLIFTIGLGWYFYGGAIGR
jgi:membrane protease YdiL (CAAX protease family)